MRRRYLPLIVLLIFVVIIGGSWLRIFNDYWQLVLLFIGINIILTVSLNLINGSFLPRTSLWKFYQRVLRSEIEESNLQIMPRMG